MCQHAVSVSLPALEILLYPRFRVIVTTLINIGPTMLTFGGLVFVSGVPVAILRETSGKMSIHSKSP